MIYFIDTNIFLRVLVQDDIKLAKDCIQLLKNVKEGKLKAVTNSLVLAEIVWTLQSFYKLSKRQTVRALKGILNLKGLTIRDQYNPQDAIFIYEKRKVKYIDAAIASIEQIMAKKWIIISYDADFDKLSVIRKEPKEVI